MLCGDTPRLEQKQGQKENRDIYLKEKNYLCNLSDYLIENKKINKAENGFLAGFESLE